MKLTPDLPYFDADQKKMIASLVQVDDRMNALNWKQAWGDRAALMQKHTDLCAKFDGQHGHIKLVHAGRLYQHAQRAGTAYQRGEKRTQGLEFVGDDAGVLVLFVLLGKGVLSGTDIQCQQGGLGR